MLFLVHYSAPPVAVPLTLMTPPAWPQPAFSSAVTPTGRNRLEEGGLPPAGVCHGRRPAPCFGRPAGGARSASRRSLSPQRPERVQRLHKAGETNKMISAKHLTGPRETQTFLKCNKTRNLQLHHNPSGLVY